MNSKQALLGISGFGLIVSVLFVFITHPSGYQASVYSGFTLAWFAIIATLIMFIITVLRTNYIIRPLAILFSLYGVIFTIPFHLGVRFWAIPRSDTFIHFSRIIEVLQNGHISSTDQYPLLKVLASEIALATSLPVELLQVIIMYLASIILLGNTALFAREIYQDERAVKLGIAIGAPFIYAQYHRFLLPWFIGFISLPLILLIAQRINRTHSNRRQLYLSATIMVFATVLYHPMGAFVLAAAILALTIATRFSYQRQYRSHQYGWFLIIGIASTVWYLSFGSIIGILTSLVRNTLSGGGVSKTSSSLETTYTIQQLVTRFVVGDFGVLILYLGIGVMTCGFVLSLAVYRGTVRSSFSVPIVLFVTGGCIGVLFLVWGGVINDFYRMNQLTILAAVLVLTGLGIWSKNSPETHIQVIWAIIVVCVILAAVLSPYMLYDQSQYVTEQEFVGGGWLIDRYNEDRTVVASGTTGFLTTYLRPEFVDSTDFDNRPFVHSKPVPKNLGYRENTTIVESIGPNKYVVTKSRDILWIQTEPQNRWSELNYYTHSDMVHLSRDETGQLVYSNGEFKIWKTNS